MFGGLWARRCLPQGSPCLGTDHNLCSLAGMRTLASPPCSHAPRAGAWKLSTAAHHGGPAAGCCPAAALSQ